jgi:hypothetical protein
MAAQRATAARSSIRRQRSRSSEKTSRGAIASVDRPPGARRWAIADGYIPPDERTKPRALQSHEALCVVNAGKIPAHLTLRVFYADRDPAGPYEWTVPPHRTRHVRLNDLADPEPIPHGTDYAMLLESDTPVIVQHTRLDSRQRALALFSTVACACE